MSVDQGRNRPLMGLQRRAVGGRTTTDSATPVAVRGLTGAAAISAGQSHTCALIKDGTARCWGWNDVGQLRDATTTNSSTPVAVSG